MFKYFKAAGKRSTLALRLLQTNLLNVIVLPKVFEDASSFGPCFRKLVTMEDGFGYKGSRVYAIFPGEWCLLGDVLYQMDLPGVSLNEIEAEGPPKITSDNK